MEMNKQISELTNIVLALTEKISSPATECSGLNTVINTNVTRSDTLYIKKAVLYVRGVCYEKLLWSGYEKLLWSGYEKRLWSGYEKLLWSGNEKLLWSGYEKLLWSSYEKLLWSGYEKLFPTSISIGSKLKFHKFISWLKHLVVKGQRLNTNHL